MRLLKFGSDEDLRLSNHSSDNIPAYAILSHTWGADEDEVTLNDVHNGSGKSKAGFTKLQFCGQQASKNGLQYFWVDTCCIDKATQTELSEAITSMFRWYRNAAQCYVYLSDVSIREEDNGSSTERPWESAFRNSRWFRRGWTLQELLAPRSVVFFSREGKYLGDRNTLKQVIHEITTIPTTALCSTSLSHYSIDEKMRWVRGRETKKIEDRAYCLLGIFGVYTYLNYGEGDNAFIRLQQEIRCSSEGQCRSGSNIYAEHLADLYSCQKNNVWKFFSGFPKYL
jgi:Heterokaryon incompatibility protein (HET)